MAKIKLEQNHSKPVPDVKTGIDAMMERMKSMGVEATWKGDTMHLSGKGIKGTVAVTAAKVAVDLDLGLPVSLMKGKIEEKIRHGLETKLA
jgi:putative polyhydroxyalkanoate system protein